jgi:FdrA protein
MVREDKAADDRKAASLLRQPLRIVNVGLERFAEDLAAHGTTVQQVQWAPPAGGDARLADLLSKVGT